MKIGHKLANLFQLFPSLKTATFPKSVRIVEVGPRDGLQNEKKIIPTDVKINLINSLTNCGFETIESTSFVSPKWVPQMADSSQTYKGITKKENVSYTALVPNMKGFEQALNCDVKEIALFTAASESFTKKNINCTIEESLVKFEEIAKVALEKNIRVRGYVSCIMGCPYEGEIDPKIVNEIAERLIKIGCYEISLGDTIGIGTPEKTLKLMDTLTVDKSKLAAHYHNTYDRALENLVLSLYHGISVIDSSLAGLGGCPYAKGASGNIATEDVLYLCKILGVETNIDFKQTVNLGKYVIDELGYENRTSVKLEDLESIEMYKAMLH